MSQLPGPRTLPAASVHDSTVMPSKPTALSSQMPAAVPEVLAPPGRSQQVAAAPLAHFASPNSQPVERSGISVDGASSGP